MGICTPCGTDTKELVFCEDCRAYLCRGCKEFHHGSRQCAELKPVLADVDKSYRRD